VSHPEGTLREMLFGAAERLRRERPDGFGRALLPVVREARSRKVPVREVSSPLEGGEAEVLYLEARRIVNLLELADRDAPEIVRELEDRLTEILNPQRPLEGGPTT
jgi:hypothetical protein